MRNFQKRERLKYIMQSKLFLMFLRIGIFTFIYRMFSFINKLEETGKNRKIVEDKITELEKSKEKLNSDIIKLKTEKGIEESIRERFGLAKDGEGMIMVIDDKNQIKTQKEPESGVFWSVIKSWFK